MTNFIYILDRFKDSKPALSLRTLGVFYLLFIGLIAGMMGGAFQLGNRPLFLPMGIFVLLLAGFMISRRAKRMVGSFRNRNTF